MTFRFSKRVTIFPGFKLNFGKRGISTTIGGNGVSMTLGRRGIRASAGIPGSGLSVGGNVIKFRGKNPPNLPAGEQAAPMPIEDRFFMLLGTLAWLYGAYWLLMHHPIIGTPVAIWVVYAIYRAWFTKAETPQPID